MKKTSSMPPSRSDVQTVRLYPVHLTITELVHLIQWLSTQMGEFHHMGIEAEVKFRFPIIKKLREAITGDQSL